MEIFWVFRLRQVPGQRAGAKKKGPYGNASRDMNMVFGEKNMEDLVDAVASRLSAGSVNARGISFNPPASLYVPPVGEPLLIVPFTKAEQKEFLKRLIKHREVPSNIRQLLAA